MSKVYFVHEPGDTYEVTGVDVYGKRFKIVTDNVRHATGINVYRGTLWQRKKGATSRRRICEYWN